MSFSRSLPNEIRTQDKVIGLFVVLAFALVLYLILHQTYFQSQKQQWIRLHSTLTNSFGITQGTLIELSGVTIGNVDSVVLRPDARVEVETLVDNQYGNLLREGSQLKVSSQLGLDTVLAGARLELVPGESSQLLETGDAIAIVEPKSLDQMMQEMRLEELALQVQSIVANIEKITGNLAGQQDQVASTLGNIDQFTGQLVEISRTLPALLGNVNQTLQAVQLTLNNLDQNVNQLMSPASELMTSSNTMVQTTNATVAAMQPTLALMPDLLASTNRMLLSINQLSQQLSRHWLLGGEGTESTAGGGSSWSQPVLLLPDETLYSAPGGAPETSDNNNLRSE